jgi:pyridoxine 5-phosphate synthase
MSGSLPLRLGVNIDHVATIRNARGGARPDPVQAALLAIKAGADGITAHLREDRRHIRDRDMERLKAEISKPLNFEMGATTEMVAIAKQIRPHAVCLVPEKREERTTEGGLDIIQGEHHLRPIIDDLSDHGARVSLFIEPDLRMLEMAVSLKAPVVELHTGRWCEDVLGGKKAAAQSELGRLNQAAKAGRAMGLEVHAGHGLDFDMAEILAENPDFHEFNIGHFLIGDAMFHGLGESIRMMRVAMDRGRMKAG